MPQMRRPIEIFSRTLIPCEQRHSALEKEAHAIVEAFPKWRHLIGRYIFFKTRSVG